MKLDFAQYKNASGQEFTVSKFRYYIGHLELVAKNGAVFKTKNYFLIDEEDAASKKISLPDVPNAEYVAMNVTLGVDSADNCSGAQSGALDPVHGMFWTWNTGYIFLKLEGKAAASSAPGHIFEYHIGGYKKPVNCIRKIKIDFIEPLMIQENQTATLSIETDLLKVISGKTNIDFRKLPVVSDLLHAEELADNYALMFRHKQK